MASLYVLVVKKSEPHFTFHIQVKVAKLILKEKKKSQNPQN